MNAINQKTISNRIFNFVFPVFVILLVQLAVNAQTFQIDGSWEMYNDKNVKFDKPATITQSGGNLSINNGYGSNSTATLSGNTFKTSDGLTGTISVDSAKINWSNGFVWLKLASNSTNLQAQPVISLNGNWEMFGKDGLPYEKNAVITQNGTRVTLNNGYGSEETVNFVDSKLMVRSWRLTGTVSADGKRIDWSNGYYWVKKDLWDRPQIKPIDDTPTSKPTPIQTTANTVRTVTLKNYGQMSAALNVYRGDLPFDNTVIAAVEAIGSSQIRDSNLDAAIPANTQLEIEVTMLVGVNRTPLPIYRAIVNQNGSSNLCFEVRGTIYVPSVKPCNNTQAAEAQYVEVKNESGFTSKVTMDYTQQSSDGSFRSKTFTSDEMILGFYRKIYVPRDAAPDRDVTVNLRIPVGTFNAKVERNKEKADCYKIWGNAYTPKVSPCYLDSSDRKITLRNQGAIHAQLFVTYYDKAPDGVDIARTVNTNSKIEYGTEETIAVPQGTSDKPVEIKIEAVSPNGDKLRITKVPADFTGELCYRAEGIVDRPTYSTCDNVVGDMLGETRQIKFQNDSGFDAELVVTYFSDEIINGNTIPMHKIITTGLINGLGKYRLVTIPAKTSKGMKVNVYMIGNATLNNGFFKIELDGDFSGSPLQCFKAWGTLFSPQGGSCQ